MMGRQEQPQHNLFHYSVNLDKWIRNDHPPRTVNELIDFDSAYAEVKNCSGNNGNESVISLIILKLMLFLVFYKCLLGTGGDENRSGANGLALVSGIRSRLGHPEPQRLIQGREEVGRCSFPKLFRANYFIRCLWGQRPSSHVDN